MKFMFLCSNMIDIVKFCAKISYLIGAHCLEIDSLLALMALEISTTKPLFSTYTQKHETEGEKSELISHTVYLVDIDHRKSERLKMKTETGLRRLSDSLSDIILGAEGKKGRCFWRR